MDSQLFLVAIQFSGTIAAGSEARRAEGCGGGALRHCREGRQGGAGTKRPNEHFIVHPASQEPHLGVSPEPLLNRRTSTSTGPLSRPEAAGLFQEAASAQERVRSALEAQVGVGSSAVVGALGAGSNHPDATRTYGPEAMQTLDPEPMRSDSFGHPDATRSAPNPCSDPNRDWRGDPNQTKFWFGTGRAVNGAPGQMFRSLSALVMFGNM